MFYFFLLSFLILLSSSYSLKTGVSLKRKTNYHALKSVPVENLSFNIAELFSGPAATYNGELIDKSLKLVEKVPKPPGLII